jgi:hypothetical protein
LAFQQLAHQTLGCLGIATTLHQNVEDETILINGAPEPVLLAADRDHRLISPAKASPNFSAHSRTV